MGALAGHSKCRVTPFHTCGFRNKLGPRVTPQAVNSSSRDLFVLPIRPSESPVSGPISWGATSVSASGGFCFSGWAISPCKVRKAVRQHRKFCRWSVGRPGAMLPAGAPGPPFGSGTGKGGLCPSNAAAAHTATRKLRPWSGKERWTGGRLLLNSFCSWGDVTPWKSPLGGRGK